MADIGDLVATLRLQNEGFIENLKLSEHEMEHLGDVAKEVGSAIGLAFGAEKFVEGIKGQIEAVTELIHTSEKLDISVSSLQALQHQANMNHVSFESLTTGLERMQKNLAEAATGELPETARAFERIHINVADIIGLSADEQFETIAESIRGLENATDRAQAEFKIFGRGGIELNNIIMEGKKGFDEAKKYIKEAGIEVSKLDAKTLQKADVSMKQMGEEWNVTWREMAISIAPTIIGLQRFLSFFTGGEQWKGFLDWMNDLGVKLGLNDTLLSEDEHFMESLERSTSKAARQKQSLALAEAEAAKATKEYNDIAKEAQQVFEETQTPLEKLEEKVERAGELFEMGAISEETYFRTLEKWSDEANKPMTDLFKQMEQEGQRLTEALETPLQRAESEFEKAQELFNEGFVNEDVVAMAFSNIGDEVAKLRDKQMKPLIDDMKAMEDAADRVWEQTRTPMEKYKEEVGELDDLLMAGALDFDTYGRGVDAAKKKLDQETGKDKSHEHEVDRSHFSVTERGSREDYDKIFAAINNRKDDPAKVTAQATQKIAQHTAKQTSVQEQIASSLKDIKTWELGAM